MSDDVPPLTEGLAATERAELQGYLQVQRERERETVLVCSLRNGRTLRLRPAPGAAPFDAERLAALAQHVADAGPADLLEAGLTNEPGDPTVYVRLRDVSAFWLGRRLQ